MGNRLGLGYAGTELLSPRATGSVAAALVLVVFLVLCYPCLSWCARVVHVSTVPVSVVVALLSPCQSLTMPRKSARAWRCPWGRVPALLLLGGLLEETGR
jgi:hypothetical protein